MKKILLLAIIASGTNISNAQEGGGPPIPKEDKGNTFELQAKGIVNASFLLNKNISDTGDEQDYAAGLGLNYGLAFNAYFGNVGFGIEALMGNHKGSYAGTVSDTNSINYIPPPADPKYKSSVNLSTISIPVLFKLKSKDGTYFEVGPQYNIITAAKFKRSDVDGTIDKRSNYASSYFSGVIGFGFKIPFGPTSPCSIGAGLRINYSFTDLKGVDGLGNDLNDPYFYTNKASTAAASGGLAISFTYKLGKKE